MSSKPTVAFCSISTMNFTHYAAVLNKTLRKAGHKEPHYLLVVDYQEDNKSRLPEMDCIILTLPQLEVSNINDLLNRYSAFEISNVLKPTLMKYLLKNYSQIEYLAYLDTDIMVFYEFSDAVNQLNVAGRSVLLTPHINTDKYKQDFGTYESERQSLRYGLFNGGFYLLKNDKNSFSFLTWQENILSKFGYALPELQMYVDQKILDLAPQLFDFITIYKNRAYNLGHWNIIEDEFHSIKNDYYLNNKKIVFFHFSRLARNKYNSKSYLLNEHLISNKSLLKLADNYYAMLTKADSRHVSQVSYGHAALFNPKEQPKQSEHYKDEEIRVLNEKLNNVITTKGWKAVMAIYWIRDQIKTSLMKLINI